MAIASNFPAIKPSLLLDFANTKKLDPRITFTRTTTATYYDGVTTAKAEENLLLQSQDFTTTWGATNATVTANTTTAPDGTSTAETFDDDVANGVHDVSQTIVTTTGTTYTLSAFLKNVDRQYAILACSGAATSYASAKFDLSAGTLGSTAASGAGWSVVSSSITAVVDSWYRCTITFVVGTTIGNTARIGMATDGTTFTASQRGLEVYTGSDKTIFVWGAQLEQRSSVTAYTATTTQPITNYIPVLLTAASGVARFNHNPTTDESLGLLIEEARTNTCLQSENFSTTWSATRATLSTNSSVSPAGTLTADKLIATTDNDTHFVAQTFTGTAASWTFTVYAKALDYSFVALRLFNGTSQVGLAYYNLSTGTTATVTAGTASIQSVGNGWYRCALTATLAASASCTADIQLANADNTNSFAGNGYSGISIWGSQVELGASPTSYIATTSATVTRNADAASMTGSNFSSWFRQDEGTFFADWVASGAGTNRYILDAQQVASQGNRFDININTLNTVNLRTVVGGSAVASLTGGTYTVNTAAKIAFGYKVSDYASSFSGAAAVTASTSGVLPTPDILYIGSLTGSSSMNGTIKKIAYYPLRLTNANLQALTS
jgi:hypothetical protein